MRAYWLMGLLLLCGALAAEEVAFKYNGMQLRANLEKAETWPKGPVILMTHGTLAHNRMEIMATLQELFKENGVSTLAINLSLGIDGRPSRMYDCKKPHRHRHEDAVKEIAAWVEWLKFEDVEHIVLLGHSRGGNQTAWYAVERPDPKVSKVILLAPQTWSEAYARQDYKKRYGQDLEPILQQAQAMIAAGKGDALLPPVGFIYCPNARPSAAAFVSYYRTDPRLDTPYLLNKIQQPTLVFIGTDDRVVRDLEQKLTALAAQSPRVRIEVIEGADHFFRDLYAEEVVEQALEFIQD